MRARKLILATIATLLAPAAASAAPTVTLTASAIVVTGSDPEPIKLQIAEAAGDPTSVVITSDRQLDAAAPECGGPVTALEITCAAGAVAQRRFEVTTFGGGDEVTITGSRASQVSLGGGGDFFSGGSGKDTVDGGAGNDVLLGRAGDDALSGGEGDDLLSGGEGTDTLVGGPGTDGFQAATGDGIDALDSAAKPVDADQDGAPAPTDCNDLSAAIRPGRTDVPGNGVDEDCSGADTTIAAVASTVAATFSVTRAGTRVRALRVTGIPRFATVEVRCTGVGCPFRLQSRAFNRGAPSFSLASFFLGRRLRPGRTIQVRVTVDGATGVAVKYLTRRGRQPARTARTLPAQR